MPASAHTQSCGRLGPPRSVRRTFGCAGLGAAGVLLIAAGCGPIADEPETICPSALPEAVVSQTSTASEARITATAGARWTFVAWAVSELAAVEDNATVTYGLDRSGALATATRGLGSRGPRRRSAAVEAIAYTPERLGRLDWHHHIWRHANTAPIDPARLDTTAIRGHTADLLPPGALFQTMTCGQANPGVCGASALCVLSSGTCESVVSIKFWDSGGNTETVMANVRKVGTHVAVVIDGADDAAVSDADVDALISRFDGHIAPRLHQFFGEPRHEGFDRDRNGVVIAFLTNRVASTRQGTVGYFLPDDIRPIADAAHSNEADLLYMRPPGNGVSLDALSGTIGHEYQHLINYYAKVTKRGSDPEMPWLDEGLATFAEDLLGYGSDAFKNVLAYLDGANDTSLTGYGLIHRTAEKADSFERRGMAHLFARHLFERAGGATFGDGPGEVTDLGGVSAIRALVQSEDTGSDILSAVGQPLASSLPRFLTSVAVDGTALDCIAQYGFAEPEIDAYTGFQRGVDLRKSIEIPGAAAIPLAGPQIIDLEAIDDELPTNGGQFRRVSLGAGDATVSLRGSSEYTLGFRVFAEQ